MTCKYSLSFYIASLILACVEFDNQIGGIKNVSLY